MLNDMNATDRLRLMQFVCSFAWADLEVRPEEREFIRKLVGQLGLSPDEQLQVQRWLQVPPDPDPADVPREHRQAFLDAIDGLIRADGEIADEELDSFAVFRMLLEERGD